MDILNKIVTEQRKSFESNSQLILEEFVEKLKDCVVEDEKKSVVFDFEYAFPTGLSSWRGSYDELALEYELGGYSYCGCGNDSEAMELNDFIELCEESVGKTYFGWKGGEFTMSKKTPLWVANAGNSGNTAVVDVLDNGYQVVVITKWMEY